MDMWKDGYVYDIFVSRKKRWSTNNAMRAIRRLNGVEWRGVKLAVSLSAHRRELYVRSRVHGSVNARNREEKMVKKWVAIRRTGNGFNGNGGIEPTKETVKSNGKKEVEVIWSVKQKEMLQRSLLGVCVEPIEFRSVMNKLLDEWNGPGTIECRDVGPYRCLITFSSTEIRDQAMSNEPLLSVFDKVRFHWDFVSSLSRRVWVEIMGLPVNLWCTENLQSISKLWGKFIMVDDRTGDPKSFSIARVLLDCFQ
ncbi:hypothetical protein PIB30_054386 [Stylosanthes scabra]|uniref:DUF4283 domain-containing protein n=1 Tax=Stylosanthes scabra TaxID=79078 RepID=A0ABU6ULQ0_9FABA|nr:hypothetical protein [Stylosanthes scabra]